jgi:hypothetical protein
MISPDIHIWRVAGYTCPHNGPQRNYCDHDLDWQLDTRDSENAPVESKEGQLGRRKSECIKQLSDPQAQEEVVVY